jgi:radical SAM protein with 4Fe4S-binding SPASM domain
MKAKDISGQAPGGKRTKLADVIPLPAPYVVQIFPVYACNFKCGYCIFSVDKPKRGFISDKTKLELALYKRCVDEMALFPSKIKVLRFVGIGEPLLHKDIAEMITYSAEKKIAGTIELLTNGLLLTPKMSDDIIKAGLNRIVISVQGTSAEKYLQVCGTKIDFDGFMKNLDYLYKHKGNAHIYIKIVDTALENKEDVQRFFDIFGEFCDTIAVEHTVPIHSGIDYDKVLNKNITNVTQFGLPISDVKVCPQPFFTMQINPDGNVVPCYSFEYPVIVGNCNNEPAHQIWKNKQFNQFRLKTLSGSGTASEACKNCSIIKYRMFPEDDLKNCAEGLKKHFKEV